MRLTLSATDAAPRRARVALEDWLLSIVDEDAMFQIAVATSEVVTNAVRHAGLERSDMIQLRGEADEDTVRIEVEQASSAASVRLVPATDQRDSRDGGFGLRIVDELSSRWGVVQGPPGRVWFELDEAQ
jgi:anti-sigma regulatory factor (Ser/Thr protein kinase)